MSVPTGRRAVLAVLAALSVLAAGCTTSAAPSVRATSGAAGTVEVDYGGALARLATLDPADAGQQVQDWTRLGLASALGMTGDQVLDETYDATALRDESLDGLAEQPATAGRSLFDPRTGTLHLIVPAGDAHPQRTLAGLLDDRRADRGADPARVQVHTASVDGPGRRVRLDAGPVQPLATLRTANGWIESRIDDPASLAAFLGRADRLSRVEVRGTALWAQGWDFPGTDGPVTPADVAVLTRGYAHPPGYLPGFSLDPQAHPDADDLRAVLTGVAPAVLHAMATGDYAGSGFASAHDLSEAAGDTLFNGTPHPGLPTDRTVLWAVQRYLDGSPVYSQARYDGGIAGTEVGRTLFYTDMVAKNWTTGVGSAVPYGPVPGFVPDDRAQTPPGLCGAAGAPTSGRLWFGQHDAAFRYQPDGVSIGAQATRLYSRANGPAGSEVEPEYQDSRSLRWWDRNVEAMGDYDGQYRRLEQLMRWSGVLDWLTQTGHPLPAAGDVPAPDGDFASWYASSTDLRERAPLPIVHPPSAHTEALLTVPSMPYSDCGAQQISGGVSLADVSVRGGLPRAADLPPALSRARAADPAGTHLDARGDGTISRRPEQSAVAATPTVYTLRHSGGPDGTSSSEVTAGAGAAVRAGDARLVTDGARTYGQVFRSDGPNYAIDVTTQGIPDGSVAVTADGGGAVRISYRPGVRELVNRLVDRFRSGQQPPQDGVLRYQYGVPGGQVLRADDGTEAVTVATGRPDPAAFRTDGAVEYRDASGALQRLAVGAPRDPPPGYVAALGAPSVPVHTTYGELTAALPPGAAVYLTDPATVLPGTVSPDLPVTFRTRSPRPGGLAPAPEGVFTGPRLPWQLADLAGGGSGGGSGGGPPRPWFPGGGPVVVVTACPPDDRQLTPEQREECQQ